MKRYINKLFLFLIASAMFMACDEENGRTEFEGPFFVELNSTSASISESSSDFVSIKVNNAGPTLDTDIIVGFTVEGSTAIEGEDYNYVKGTQGEIVIPAGKNTGEVVVQMIPNLAVDGDKTLTVTITSNNAGLNVGRGELGKTFSLTIIDDDCPIDLVNDYEGEWEVASICAPPGSFNDGFCVSSQVGQVVTLTADASDPLGFTAILTGGIHADPMILNFQTCPGTVSISSTYTLSFNQNGSPATIGPTDEPETFGTGTYTDSKITVVGTYGNTSGSNFDEFVIEYTKL